MGGASKAPFVAISCARDDEDVADALTRRLAERLPDADVFFGGLAQKSSHLPDSLRKKYRVARFMVAIVGDSYADSDWCRTEWSIFCERLADPKRSSSVKLVTLVKTLPRELKKSHPFVNFVPYKGHKGWQEPVDRVVADIASEATVPVDPASSTADELVPSQLLMDRHLQRFKPLLGDQARETVQARRPESALLALGVEGTQSAATLLGLVQQAKRAGALSAALDSLEIDITWPTDFSKLTNTAKMRLQSEVKQTLGELLAQVRGVRDDDPEKDGHPDLFFLVDRLERYFARHLGEDNITVMNFVGSVRSVLQARLDDGQEFADLYVTARKMKAALASHFWSESQHLAALPDRKAEPGAFATFREQEWSRLQRIDPSQSRGPS